jgi:hypothetical protein
MQAVNDLPKIKCRAAAIGGVRRWINKKIIIASGVHRAIVNATRFLRLRETAEFRQVVYGL